MPVTYEVLEAPPTSPVKVGEVLTLHQAARLFEEKVNEMAIRSDMAATIKIQGHKLKVIKPDEPWREKEP